MRRSGRHLPDENCCPGSGARCHPCSYQNVRPFGANRGYHVIYGEPNEATAGVYVHAEWDKGGDGETVVLAPGACQWQRRVRGIHQYYCKTIRTYQARVRFNSSTHAARIRNHQEPVSRWSVCASILARPEEFCLMPIPRATGTPLLARHNLQCHGCPQQDQGLPRTTRHLRGAVCLEGRDPSHSKQVRALVGPKFRYATLAVEQERVRVDQSP